MGEGVRGHVTLGLPLNPIVPDSGGGTKALFHITRFQHVLLGRRIPPDTGQAIGLELHGHRVLIPLSRIGSL